VRQLLYILMGLGLLFPQFGFCEGKARVEVGFGRINIVVDGVEIKGKAFDAKTIEDLETELLIDEDLAHIVMDQNKLTIDLNLKSLEKLNSEDWRERLKLQVKSQLLPKNREIEEKEAEDIQEDARVIDRRVVMGSHASFDSATRIRELIVIGGSVEIFGQVDELVVMGGTVVLHPGSRVRDLSVMGGQVDQKQGAVIDVRKKQASNFSYSWMFQNRDLESWDVTDLMLPAWLTLTWVLTSLLGLLVVGFLYLLMAPRHAEESLGLMEKEISTGFFVGFVNFLLLVPISILLVVTILGIAVIPLFWFFQLVLFYLGKVIAGVFLVQRIRSQLSEGGTLSGRGYQALNILLSVLLVWAISFIPFLGGWIEFALYLVGAGAFLTVCYRHHKSRRQGGGVTNV
jgi:hypothetical protein